MSSAKEKETFLGRKRGEGKGDIPDLGKEKEGKGDIPDL
jgi:hypothetical protein